jgi:hypothetical protein
MSVILAFFATSLGKYILGAGVAIIAALGWGVKQRMAGKAAERARQAAADAKAKADANQVRTQVDAMKPSDVRAELAKRATDK